MSFATPEWFLLLPLLVAVGWLWKGLGLWRPLRIVILLLGVIALARPQLGNVGKGMDLWVLIDRSDSAEAAVATGMEEWFGLLKKGTRTAGSEMRTVHFAGDLSEPDPNLDEMGGLTGGLSRLKLGIEGAMAMAKPSRPSRVLLFTDGFSTEPLDGIGEKMRDAGIPLDVRMLPAPGGEDVRLSSLEAPARVRPGESFVISVDLAGSDGEVSVEVMRDGEALGAKKATIAGGRANLRFAMRLEQSGAHRYEVRVRKAGDEVPGNDVRSCWVEVSGGPRILFVSRYPDDPMMAALQATGFEVDRPENPRTLTLGRLAGCRAVVIHDIPAPEFDRTFLEGLDFFVREQGGGLLMVGGKHSFGSGGYFESPVDPLLPVSMELKAEHRKLAIAMAIVMDRSGSMSMTVPGGQTKMSLANEGAGRAVELLGQSDLVTVLAVDSSAHEMVPLLNVGKHRDDIIARVRRVQSMGGGIYVYTGLEAAVARLNSADVGQRHIILFSDAMDSEEPGEYKRLVADFTIDGGTISVIGLGTRTDSDADFLQDIGDRGGGRVFFSADPSDIPNLFAQDAAAVARSAFLEDPTPTVGSGGWVEVAGSAPNWLDTVDGYNLCYLREGDSEALRTGDEYTAPLIATGRRGLGRTAAVTFPLAGEHGKRAREWPEVADFVQTLGGWLAGEEAPRGVALRAGTDGTELGVRLLTDPEAWAAKLAGKPPQIALSIADGPGSGSGAGRSRTLPWRRLSPGELRAGLDLAPGQLVRGAVQIGDSVLPFGPYGVGGEVEWDFDPARRASLLRQVEMSGGRELINLEDAWLRPEGGARASLVRPLTIVVLLLILIEALLTRLGKGNWDLSKLKIDLAKWVPKPKKVQSPTTTAVARARAEAKARAKAKEAAAKKDGTPKPDPAPKPAPAAKKSASLSGALSKAKRKKK